MSKKEKKKAPITPIAPCIYPFLKKPDTRWKKEGEYRVTLIFDSEDEFLKEIEEKARKEFDIAKNNLKPAQAAKLKFISPIKPEVDDDDNPTGNMRLNFKSNTQYSKDEEVYRIKLKLFDSQGQPIVNVPNFGNGSKMAISFNPIGTVVKDEFYLTLWINAVQIIELIEYNPDGSSYGFEKTEGGYNTFESEDGYMPTEDTQKNTEPDTDDSDDF